MKQLTWLKLLEFLLELKKQNKLPENDEIILHNVETDDEYLCDIITVNDRLVMAINWELLEEE